MNHGGLSSNNSGVGVGVGGGGGMQAMQMPPSMQNSGVGMYDHMQPSVNINGVNMSPKTDQQQSQMLQSQHLNPLPPQNQFLQNRNTNSVSFTFIILFGIIYSILSRFEFYHAWAYSHRSHSLSLEAQVNYTEICVIWIQLPFSILEHKFAHRNQT